MTTNKTRGSILATFMPQSKYINLSRPLDE